MAAKKCEFCNSVYNSRLSGCPKSECAVKVAEALVLKKAAEEKIRLEVEKIEQEAEKAANLVKEQNAPFASHKKSVRRPLRRGKFTR